MKIAVTYENGDIFQHFGHTEQMKLYEVENDRIVSTEVLSTNGNGHGALANFLHDLGAEILICGGIGAGAQNALAQAGIKIYGGCRGSADQAVENFLNHTLMYDPDVCCSHHEEGHSCGEHDCSSHDCGHDCGSNCGDDSRTDRMITLTIQDENGQNQDEEFRVIAIYTANNQKYIALTPDIDMPELEADIFLFRYVEENGQSAVEEIGEDAEFAMAADAFQQWQQSRNGENG